MDLRTVTNDRALAGADINATTHKSHIPSSAHTSLLLTLSQLDGACLHKTDIRIEEPSKRPGSDGQSQRPGHPESKRCDHPTHGPDEQRAPPADPVTELCPWHPAQKLAEGEDGDEEACVEGDVCLVDAREGLDHGVDVGEYARPGDCFGCSEEACVSLRVSWW